MPWRQEAMKDVPICDKPRSADKGRLNLGFPNGETRHLVSSMTEVIEANQGKWNISVPWGKEIKSEIPSVAASERGTAQKLSMF